MLQGVTKMARKRHNIAAPNFLQGSYDVRSDAMQGTPRLLQGATPWAQIAMYFSPPPITGDTDMTQQCLDHNSPRERPTNLRRNAEERPPLPTSLTGAITTSQKCYKVNAPREGSSIGRRNAIRAMPFPPVTGGQRLSAEMPVPILPPPNLGHQTPAEMPRM